MDATNRPNVSSLTKPSVLVTIRYIILRSAPASKTVKPECTSAKFWFGGTERRHVLNATVRR
jgi:hypothetical protein